MEWLIKNVIRHLRCIALTPPSAAGLLSAHWCVFQISKRHQQTSLLTPFLKNSDKFRNFLFSCTFGGDWGKYSKNGLTFGCLKEFIFLKFWHKNYFFQAKTEFCNFYTNIYEYSKPDLKNLISGLSESVKKFAKNGKL